MALNAMYSSEKSLATVEISPGNKDKPSTSSMQIRYISRLQQLLRACFCEFIGDMIFVFMGSLAVAVSSAENIVGIALAHGICIAVLIAGMGHISGGHFNPAVTLGVLVSGNIKVINAVAYMICQLLGGFFGALLVKAVLPNYTSTVAGVTGVPMGEYPMQPITAEIIMTYLLVSTVLLTAVDQEGFTLAPLAIGLSIVVDILAGGGVSGASMNPARSFGPVVAQSLFGQDAWALHYVDWVGPAIGGAIAGLVYNGLAYSILTDIESYKTTMEGNGMVALPLGHGQGVGGNIGE